VESVWKESKAAPCRAYYNSVILIKVSIKNNVAQMGNEAYNQKNTTYYYKTDTF
jgi:hypothetical protein